jgi:hypothetical protein
MTSNGLTWSLGAPTRSQAADPATLRRLLRPHGLRQNP